MRGKIKFITISLFIFLTSEIFCQLNSFDTIFVDAVINTSGQDDQVDERPIFPGCGQLEEEDARRKCSELSTAQYIYSQLEFPRKALNKRKEGKVIAEWIIDEDGNMGEINIVEDSGYGFGKSVKKVLKKMSKIPEKWIPARLNGKYITYKMTFPVNFKIGS